MTKTTLGLLFAFAFVLLESTQFVYFGGLFQKMNSFQFGFLVFFLTIVIFVGWTAISNPGQIRNALGMRRELIAVNLGAVVTFTAYLLSVQLIEPAIAYTVSAGTMPISAYLLYRLGIREGENMRNKAEAIGNSLIFASIVFLALITMFGLSGFVRGDSSIAVLGVLLAIVDGVFFTLILVYSQRLNRNGVGPSAVLGLRLPMYVVVTGGLFYLGLGYQPAAELTWAQTGFYVAVGFLLLIPPLYFFQKAASLLSALTISALTALGPFVIFCLQLVEGRVDYSPMTLAGLSIYIVGAVLSAFGALKATTSTA